MYCVRCGVKLADTEKKCPLCNTVVYHPELKQKEQRPLYPVNKLPKSYPGSKTFNGAIIILFLIPVIVCLFADLSLDGRLEWFGYVAGALILGYVIFALPLWFRKPNPVIFVPCDFAAIGVYLLYINIAVKGNWFLSFGLPVLSGTCLIVCTVVTLTYYLRRGRLYIFGGAFMALGLFMLLIEFLMKITFDVEFIGWSIYPLATLVLFGGLLIYLGINKTAREIMERKLFL